MSYNYPEDPQVLSGLNSTELQIVLSSEERDGGTVSEFWLEDFCNGYAKGIYRIDLIGYTYTQVPGLRYIGIKLRQMESCRSRFDIHFLINNESTSKNTVGVISRDNLVNTYCLLNNGQFMNFNSLNVQFVNPSTNTPITMVGESSWHFRVRMIKNPSCSQIGK